MDKFIVPSDEEGNGYVIHCSLGPEYSKFYKWLHSVKPLEQYSDFPRHFVVLSEEDTATMLEKFAENILNEDI